MDIQKKDNLTDIVENTPKTPVAPADAQKPQAPQQVVASNGEVVTLGHNKGNIVTRVNGLNSGNRGSLGRFRR